LFQGGAIKNLPLPEKFSDTGFSHRIFYLIKKKSPGRLLGRVIYFAEPAKTWTNIAVDVVRCNVVAIDALFNIAAVTP